MPIADLLTTGAELMLLGMGIVFSFLILLVLVLKAMSWLAARYSAVEPVQSTQATPRTSPTDAAPIAVISAAVARYRSARRP